jgi:transketolase N-terminal domain/subunit
VAVKVEDGVIVGVKVTVGVMVTVGVKVMVGLKVIVLVTVGVGEQPEGRISTAIMSAYWAKEKV